MGGGGGLARLPAVLPASAASGERCPYWGGGYREGGSSLPGSSYTRGAGVLHFLCCGLFCRGGCFGGGDGLGVALWVLVFPFSRPSGAAHRAPLLRLPLPGQPNPPHPRPRPPLPWPRSPRRAAGCRSRQCRSCGRRSPPWRGGAGAAGGGRALMLRPRAASLRVSPRRSAPRRAATPQRARPRPPSPPRGSCRGRGGGCGGAARE